MWSILTAYLFIMVPLQDEVDAKVVVAGLSTTCSQKIHNQLVCIW